MAFLITTIRNEIDITISRPIGCTIVRLIHRNLCQIISINIYNIYIRIFLILLC